MEYASNAKANTAVTLGAIGTGLGILGSGMGLLNPMVGGAAIAADDRHITRHEMDMFEKLVTSERNNAILAADNTTDKKLVEVYAKLESRDKEIRQEMESMRRDQEAINREQAVYNGINTSNYACLKGQVEQLMAMTVRKIPAENVCPKPMPEFNSWTAPTT